MHLRLTEAEFEAAQGLASEVVVDVDEFIWEMLFSAVIEAKADAESWLQRPQHLAVSPSRRE